MTRTEREQALQNLVMILNDNAGNRVTLSLVNGISVTHAQFLDTLLVPETAPVADNAGEAPKE